MGNALDKAFEIIMTGMEMIDAVVEAHGSLKAPQSKDEPKSDHPASFGQSLQDEQEERRRR
jgi:hypothetical protein